MRKNDNANNYGSHDTADTAQELLVEAWREVGDGMMELQDTWVHPFLEEALDLETLHGGS